MPLNLEHVNHTNIEFVPVGNELRAIVPVVNGSNGEDGVGVPAGGTAGQVLTKTSGANFATAWQTPADALIEGVAGGAGFVNASGSVTLNLASGRIFQYTMTGNITSLAFTNVPNSATTAASWTMVLRINATGGYTLAGVPTVTWLDGSGWSDVNLAANAQTIIAFSHYGATTYAWLISNGVLELDPYKIAFQENGTVTILTEAETLMLAAATKHGDGTITFTQNGSAASGTTVFALGDRLGVVCVSATGPTTVRVPRRL
jgi:hypothetical protein